MSENAYIGPIQKQTEENNFFRKVLFTGKHAQLVLMSIEDEIGEEFHEDVDQFFRIDGGEGVVVLNGVKHSVKDGDAFLIPAGTRHNVINVSRTEPLKLYSVYSPPNHPPGTVEKTKEEADAVENSGQDRKPNVMGIISGREKTANEDEEGVSIGKKIPYDVIVKFFEKNPNPDDDQVHDLAESYGADPSAVEEQIYSIVTDLMSRVKTAAFFDELNEIASAR